VKPKAEATVKPALTVLKNFAKVYFRSALTCRLCNSFQIPYSTFQTLEELIISVHFHALGSILLFETFQGRAQLYVTLRARLTFWVMICLAAG